MASCGTYVCQLASKRNARRVSTGFRSYAETNVSFCVLTCKYVSRMAESQPLRQEFRQVFTSVPFEVLKLSLFYNGVNLHHTRMKTSTAAAKIAKHISLGVKVPKSSGCSRYSLQVSKGHSLGTRKAWR